MEGTHPSFAGLRLPDRSNVLVATFLPSMSDGGMKVRETPVRSGDVQIASLLWASHEYFLASSRLRADNIEWLKIHPCMARTLVGTREYRPHDLHKNGFAPMVIPMTPTTTLLEVVYEGCLAGVGKLCLRSSTGSPLSVYKLPFLDGAPGEPRRIGTLREAAFFVIAVCNGWLKLCPTTLPAIVGSDCFSMYNPLEYGWVQMTPDMKLCSLGPGDVPLEDAPLLCASDRDPALDIDDLPAAVATELSTLADPIATLFGPPAAPSVAGAAPTAAAGAASSATSPAVAPLTAATGSDPLAGLDALSPSGLRVPRATAPAMVPSARTAECTAVAAFIKCVRRMTHTPIQDAWRCTWGEELAPGYHRVRQNRSLSSGEMGHIPTSGFGSPPLFYASAYEHPWLKLSPNCYSYVRELREHDRTTEGWMIAGDPGGNQFIKFVPHYANLTANVRTHWNEALEKCPALAAAIQRYVNKSHYIDVVRYNAPPACGTEYPYMAVFADVSAAVAALSVVPACQCDARGAPPVVTVDAAERKPAPTIPWKDVKLFVRPTGGDGASGAAFSAAGGAAAGAASADGLVSDAATDASTTTSGGAGAVASPAPPRPLLVGPLLPVSPADVEAVLRALTAGRASATAAAAVATPATSAGAASADCSAAAGAAGADAPAAASAAGTAALPVDVAAAGRAGGGTSKGGEKGRDDVKRALRSPAVVGTLWELVEQSSAASAAASAHPVAARVVPHVLAGHVPVGSVVHDDDEDF